MRFALSISLTMLAFFLGQSDSQARGIGVRSYLLDAQGQLTAELGETSGDLLDPVAFVRYRYHNGRVSATPLDQPDKELWSASVKAVMKGRGPAWQLLPKLIVILGEDTITGIDRATGKVLYTTPSEHFTDSPASVRYMLDEQPPSLYMIDDRALRDQLRRDRPNSHPPATLARFDLLTGKFLWKTSIITPTGLKLRPLGLDPRGSIQGESDNEEFYFDPATGKALDESPLADEQASDPRVTVALPGPHVHSTQDKIEFQAAGGKRLWSRALPGEKGTALLTADSVIIPCVTGRSDTEVIALNIKDGAERWRCKLPGGFFADSVTVQVRAAKTGYLVQVDWIVLD